MRVSNRPIAALLLLVTLAGVTGSVLPMPAFIAAAQGEDAVAPGGAAPSAPPASVRMDVRAGFDGQGRLGGWVPLDVEIINEGGELRGEVQVSVQEGGARSTYTHVPTTFTLPVVLPRLSNRRFSMEINLPTVSNKVTAKLVRFPSGESIAERDVSMARVPLGDYFCGVLARDPSSYDFIAALDLPPPIRRARTAPLDPNTIPERAQLLGSFDCLIIDNAATAQLRQEQMDAIQVWVGTGGLLIAVGGATWQTTLAPLPPTLLPVEPTGLSSLSSLSALGDLFGTPVDGSGPWLVSQASPRVDRGANVVAAQDGVPLVVAAKRGEGTVIYLAFEPTARGLRGWAGFEQLWRYLITHASVDNGVGSALVRPYLRWGRIPRLGMADFSALPKASLDWLWWLMGGYGAALGGSLFLLGRRGMVGRGVLSALGLTAVATGSALVLANQRAEPDVALTRLSVVRPIEVGESSAAYTRSYVSMLAKQDGVYDLQLTPDSLAQGLFYPFPRPSNESDTTWSLRVAEGVRPTLDKVTLRQGQLATIATDGQLQQAPVVQADLRVENGALSGTLTNRAGARVTDTFLVVDNTFQPYGTLEPDQSRQVDLNLPRQAAAGSLGANAIVEKLTPANASSRPGAAARRDLIESLFAARFLYQRMEMRGPTLVGWLEAQPSPFTAPTFRLSTTELTLLVQPLQPQLPRGFEGEVPAAAMNRRDLGIGSSTPTDREFYTVVPGEAITLQFGLPPADGRFQLRQLRLNVQGQVAARTRGATVPFTVSLFNWRAAEWQPWEVSSGSSIVPDGERYMSATGEVRMRYLLDAGLSSTVREARITRLDVTPIGVVR